MNDPTIKQDSMPMPHSPLRRFWNTVVAWFFCVDASAHERISRRHWRAYSRLAAFTFICVLPLSGISWAHLVRLLLGDNEYASAASFGAGIFMMMVMMLMDSTICAALSTRTFSFVTGTVVLVRWLFALIAASSMAIGALLLVMENQLSRERADQVLATQESDQERVSQINGLEGHQKQVASAQKVRDEALGATKIVPQDVLDLNALYAGCDRELDSVKLENSRRIPPLDGKIERLRAALSRAAGTTVPNGEIADVPALEGALSEARSERGQLAKREAVKRAECVSYKARSEKANAAYQTSAHQALRTAEDRLGSTTSAQSAATAAAADQMSALNQATATAWSKNLSGELRALWGVLAKEWWARLVAILVSVFVIFMEISPMLGKMALRGGELDRLGAVDEEAKLQELETQVSAKVEFEIAKRDVQKENLRRYAEMDAIYDTMFRALDNIEAMQRRRDQASRHPDIKDAAYALFETAKAKTLKEFHSPSPMGARG